MATVTGFTAERMLQIENTTVVDGDVVGDNLILLQRDGTQINAGSVRGPQGIQGPPGTPGAVSAVNDQVGTVYAPRVFATKALLDAWTTAPIGTLAVTTDTNTVWQKDGSGWYVNNTDRIFADVADLTARWTNPPQGAIAQIRDGDSSLYKSAASTWTYNNGVRTFPSVARRDSDWLNPPEGALCFAPPPVQWIRLNSVWKPYGQLWSGVQAIDGMGAAQPGTGIRLNIPTQPVTCSVTVIVNMYAGFSANTVNILMSAYTNNVSSPIAGNGWSMTTPLYPNVAAGAWVSLSPLTLVYGVPANAVHDTWVSLGWNGLGPNLYYHGYAIMSAIAS